MNILEPPTVLIEKYYNNLSEIKRKTYISFETIHKNCIL